MDVPGIVQSVLEGEEIAAEVSLGGENTLYVTPTRTLIYQSEGFLSDESVDEYPHDAQRMTVKEGRRKTRITLEYSLDGTEEFTVPSNATDDVLHPVLAGVLNASGVTDPDETVTRTFRLDELTLVITSERLVKHVGSAVWDEDYEEYHFADVTGLEFEDGSVATQIVLTVDGRPERMKVSNERAAAVKEYLQRSLFSYYGVNSLDALNEAVAPEEDEEPDEAAAVDFGEGVDPLDAGSTVQPGEGDAAPPEPTEGDPLDAGQQVGTDAQGAAGQPGEGANAAAPGAETGSRADQPDDGQSQTEQPRSEPAESSRPGDATGGQQTQPRSDPAETRQPESQQADAQQAEPGQSEAGSESQPGQQRDRSTTSESATDAVDREPPTDDGQSTESTPTDVASAVDEVVDDTAETTAEDDDTIADSKFAEAGFQPATSAGDEALLERIETLEAKVEHQNELLEQQHQLLQQLVDELSRGR